MTNGFQPLLSGFGIQLAQVVDRDGKAAIADALGTVGQDLHAQHRMARNQFRRRVAQAVRINPGTVELDVEMGGDATELLIVVAAQPHRVLHGRQRERIAGVASRRRPGRRTPPNRRLRTVRATSADHAATVGFSASAAKLTSIPCLRHRPDNDIIRIESRPEAIKSASGSTSSGVTPRSSATSSRTVRTDAPLLSVAPTLSSKLEGCPN